MLHTIIFEKRKEKKTLIKGKPNSDVGLHEKYITKKKQENQDF